MANPVVQTSAVGVTVAVDVVGTAALQVVKLNVGASGTDAPLLGTSGAPAAGSIGVIVAVKDGVNVSVTNTVPVAVSGTVPVSGTVSVSGAVQASGTVSVSGTVPVSGTISVSNQVNVSGTLNLATAATVLTIVTLLGTVNVAVANTVTVVPAYSTVGHPGTTATGAIVRAVMYASVSAGASYQEPLVDGNGYLLVGVSNGTTVVSGTVTVNVSGIVPVTTAASVSVSGLPVWLNPTQQVVVSGLVGHSVTGSVNIVSTVVVTGSVGISGTGLVSVVPGVSVVAQASGTVTVIVSGIVPVTTAASVSVSGVPVWLNPTQGLGSVASVLGTVNVAIVAGAGGGGSVTTAGPSVTATGQVMWIAGGQSAATNPIFVSQLNPPAGGGGSVTTAAPSISATAQIMWIVGGQSTTANPVYVSGTIASVLGTVNVAIVAGAGGGGSVTTAGPSVSATGQVMWIAGGQSAQTNPIWASGTVAIVPGVSVVAQASGTVTAIVSGIVPVTTAASVSVSGLPVWLNPTQQIVVSGFAGQSVSAVVSGTVAISIPVSQALGTVITILGTQVVSVVPGLSVSAVVSGTVSVLNVVPVTTAASVSVTGLPVWLNPTQQIVVSGFAGQSVSAVVSGTVAISIPVSQALGTVITILGTQVVTVVPGLSVSAVVSGTVSVLNVVPITTAASVSVTGVPVWLNPTQPVVALDAGRTQVQIILTSTSVGISGTIMLMTVYTGVTQATAGASFWVVPAGKTFRILAAAMVVQNSVTTSPVFHRLFVTPSTAAPTWTSASPVAAAVAQGAVSAGVYYSAVGVGVNDVGAGVTVAIAHTIGTSGGSIVQAVVAGYLFP